MSRLLVIADELGFNIERWLSQAPNPSTIPTALNPDELQWIDVLANELSHHQVIDIVSSPTQRSMFLANAIAAHHSISVARDARLSPMPLPSDSVRHKAITKMGHRATSAVIQTLQDNCRKGDIVVVAHPSCAALIANTFRDYTDEDPASLFSKGLSTVLLFEEEIAFPLATKPMPREPSLSCLPATL